MIATSQQLVSTGWKRLKREVHPVPPCADAGIKKKKNHLMYEHLLIQEVPISHTKSTKGL